MENEQMILELERGSVPFTYRFLGLRLRLAFTKRRFERVEASYLQYITAAALQTANLLDGRDHPVRPAQNGPDNHQELIEVLESSFSSLRSEIDRIEESQEEMKARALPLVRAQLGLHDGFMCFLSGFTTRPTDTASLRPTCILPMLNQGEETTIAIKQLIASFMGVPFGIYMHDLRSLETLLQHSCEVCHDNSKSSDDTESLTSIDDISTHVLRVVELEASSSFLDASLGSLLDDSG
jgi:hypothetical protein